MSNRWCIISSPRSGSNYLEEMIFLKVSSTGSYTILLGEILHRIIFAYRDSNLMSYKKDSEYNSIERIDFRNTIFSKLENDHNMGAVLRLFVQSHYLPDNDYQALVNKLKLLNFKFIHLTRELFDSAISLSMANLTSLWHRFSSTKLGEYVEGNKEYARNPKSINIPIYEFGKCYVDLSVTDYHNKNILKNLEYTTVRYETILADCKYNNIPIEERTDIKKLYTSNYSTLIENYSELENFYRHMKNG
jgi:LPS sulfotransferase NodH